MDSRDYLQPGDRVRLTADERMFDGKIKARTGQEGTVKSGQYREFQYIDVQLDGYARYLSIATSKLECTWRNEEGRRESRELDEQLKATMQRFKIEPGQTIRVKPTFGLDTKTYRIYVTEVRDTGFNGYRVKADGERYGGSLGVETYFTALSLYDPAVDKIAPNVPSYLRVGNLHLIQEFRRDVVLDVEEIVHVTSRTVHVKRDEQIRKYRFGEVRWVAYPKHEIVEQYSRHRFTEAAAAKLFSLYQIRIPADRILTPAEAAEG